MWGVEYNVFSNLSMSFTNIAIAILCWAFVAHVVVSLLIHHNVL